MSGRGAVSQADERVERAAQTGDQEALRGAVGVAELTHSAIRGQLSEYLDGSLDSGDRRRVEGHVGECRDCAAYADTLRETVELVRQLPSRPAPPGAKAAILRRVQAAE
jgi:anti-sigma factor RsiW